MKKTIEYEIIANGNLCGECDGVCVLPLKNLGFTVYCRIYDKYLKNGNNNTVKRCKQCLDKNKEDGK